MSHAILVWILVNTNVSRYDFWKKVGGSNKSAASHSKINIAEGWQQEIVCFKFRFLQNVRNSHNLWEDRVAKGVEKATVY